MNDDDLDDRIRIGVAALADEAPDPPALDRSNLSVGHAPAEVHQLRRPSIVAASVAAALLLIAGLAVVLTRPDDHDTVRAGTTTTDRPTTTTAPLGDAPLYGTRWILEAAAQDGQPVEFRTGEGAPTITFDDHFTCPGTPGNCSPPTGAAYFYTTGCNSGGGSMTVEGDRITSTGSGPSTAVGCDHQIYPFALSGNGKAGPTTFEIDGDVLVLRGPDGQVLTYRASDDALPELRGTVLVQDHDGTTVYRVSWRHPGTNIYALAFDRENAGRNDSAGIVGDAKDPQVTAKKAHIYGRDLLYGLVPAETATVTYIPSKTDPIDVPVRKLDDGPFAAIATLVPSGDQLWTVVAKDADGHEIDRQTTDYTGQTIDPFGPPEGEEIARGNHKLGQYRLAWKRSGDGGTLSLDRAQATRVLPIESVSVGSSGLDDAVADVGHLSLENIIFGLAPAAGDRATVDHGVGQEGPFALRLTPIPGTDLKAFSGVVPWTSDTFDVTVYDSGGRVVSSFHHEGS